MDQLIPLPKILVTFVEIDSGWRYGVYGATSILLFFLLKPQLTQIGFWASAFWAYVLLRCLYVLQFPIIHHGMMTHLVESTAGQCFTEVLILPMATLMASKKTLDNFWHWLPVVIAYDLACVFFRHRGIFFAPSFDLAFMALCIPFVPWWTVIPILAAIFTHHGSTAYLVLASQVSALALQNKKVRPFLLLALPALYYGAKLHTVGAYFDGDERIRGWKNFMGFWQEQGYWKMAFGVNPGSFMWVSTLVGKTPLVFLQMHCDWLQVPWELGLTGLSLMIGTIGNSLVRAWGNPRLVCGIAGACAFGLTYHPLRFPLSAVAISIIFASALKAKRPKPFDLSRLTCVISGVISKINSIVIHRHPRRNPTL